MTFFEAIATIENKIKEDNVRKMTITIDYEDIDIEKIDGKWKFISDDICFKDCAVINLEEDCKLTIHYKVTDQGDDNDD